MSKKRRVEQEESHRQSRKEVLLARRKAEQTRQIRLIVAGVAAIFLVVLGVAIVNEYFIAPGRAVAAVAEDEITLGDWQDRVKYQRAQFIINMEDQLEQFGGEIGLVQQFNAQQIELLLEGEELGRLVLQQMMDEKIVEREAAQRGITVSEAEVDEAIAERFSYYGGDVPTPQPTPTETIMPTPSLTPIPTDVITDVLPTSTPFPTPTTGPTVTPLPTPTAVSADAYQELLSTHLQRFREMGVREETFRAVVRASLLREKLRDALAEEEELSPDAVHVSYYVLSFGTEEEAQAALERIEEEKFLPVWNEIRSLPPDPEVERPATATEFLWRLREQVESTYTAEVADVLFDEVELNTPTEVLEVPSATEEQPSRFYIFMVSGREERPLPEATQQAQAEQLVSSLIADQSTLLQAQMLPLWRTRVPRTPILDPMFLVQPTPMPQPTQLEPTLIAPPTETPDPNPDD